MTVLLWICAGVLVLLIIAALRDAVEDVLRAAIAPVGSVLAAMRDGTDRAGACIASAAGRARGALAYGPVADGTPRKDSIWDVVAPIVYLVLFVVLLVGDLVLAGLRFGALLGIATGFLPVTGATLDVLAGVLFVAVLGTFGAAWLDINHVTPLHRPYGLVSGPMRTVLQAVAAGGTALSVAAGMIFLVWGQGALEGAPDADLATLFVAVFGLLLVGASVLALGGSVTAPVVGWLVVLVVAGGLFAVVGWALSVGLDLLAALAHLAVRGVRLLARPGELIWNWLARLPAGTRLGLGVLPTPAPPHPSPSDDRDDQSK